MDSDNILPPHIKTTCLVAWAFFMTVEVMFGMLEGQPLPFAFGYVLLIMAGSATICWFLARGYALAFSANPRIVLLGALALSGGLLTVKLYLVAGTHFWQPYLYLLMPLLLFVPVILRAPIERYAGVLLLSIFLGLFSSTDLLKRFFLATWGLSYDSIQAGVTIALVLTGLFLAGPYILNRLGRFLRPSARRPLITAFLLVSLWLGGWIYSSLIHARPAGPAPTAPPMTTLSTPRPLSELPNIILISVDTLRWDRWASGSEALAGTPDWDLLREDSISFPQMISTSGWTLPTHASLFSGLVPLKHQAVMGKPLKYHVPFFPRALQQLGYRTAGFTDGGWVDKELGFARGYDRYWEQEFGYGDFVPGPLEITYFFLPEYLRSFELSVGRKTRKTNLKRFKNNVRKARVWLSQTPADRPFYLFLHTYRVHNYYDLYPRDMQKLRREHPSLNAEFPPAIRAGLRHQFHGVTPKRMQAYRYLYNYGIQEVDAGIGEIIRHLKSNDLYRSSVIVFLSDHGENLFLGQKRRPGHGNGQIQDTLLRVPLMIKLPDGVGGGKQYPGLVQITDVFPMIFDYLNLNLQNHPLGSPPVALQSILEETAQRGRSFTVGSRGNMDHPDSGPKAFIRTSRFKLVFNLQSHRETFYSVSREKPSQSVVSPEKIPEETRTSLRTEMGKILQQLEQIENPYRNSRMRLSPQQKKQLKGLGYLK